MKTPAVLVTVTGLFLLIVVITWLSLSRNDDTIQPGLPVQTTGQADIGEQRIILNDGQTIVTCLAFPNNAVSCDWPPQR